VVASLLVLVAMVVLVVVVMLPNLLGFTTAMQHPMLTDTSASPAQRGRRD
jgi:hypothetical protein